jgi:hypothetical protein
MNKEVSFKLGRGNTLNVIEEDIDEHLRKSPDMGYYPTNAKRQVNDSALKLFAADGSESQDNLGKQGAVDENEGDGQGE